MTSRGVEGDRYLNQVADKICLYGLQGPILIGLEAGRPLSFLAGQLIWICQPILRMVVSAEKIKKTALLLEDEKAIDHLINLLESRNKV